MEIRFVFCFSLDSFLHSDPTQLASFIAYGQSLPHSFKQLIMRSHPTRSHFSLLLPRAPSTSSCSSISSLYTSPLSTDTLPVYESITLTWNPTCVDVGTETVDLYLNVVEEQGLVAVHEWTGVDYGKGELVTMLKPGWWNASTGAGEVKAQVNFIHSTPLLAS